MTTRYAIAWRAACASPARQSETAIREIADEHVEALSDEDLAVLGYGSFVAGLEAGVAAHHAGMVPPFKEAVEACFAEALVKVVFATETLALGINMPARSVVIEQLSKFNGDTHEDLTPGEYTQLTGRAGRRGIDTVGYAVALWSPYHTFDEIAGLASSRSRALRSSFRPTYNMAVNLVRRYSRKDAYALVQSSFAQFVETTSLSRQLDAVIEVLRRHGYVKGWTVTEEGARLAGIYHDADLLIAETVRAGLLDGLDPPSLAALVSTFTYEARRGEALFAGFPSPRVERRVERLNELAATLRGEERALRLPVTRDLDPGFAGIAAAWASGEDLSNVLSPMRRSRHNAAVPPLMTGGDFVRSTKTLIDLLNQLATVLAGTPTGRTAAKAADSLLRGVVAAASAAFEGDFAGSDGGPDDGSEGAQKEAAGGLTEPGGIHAAESATP